MQQIDFSPYQESSYYQQTLQALEHQGPTITTADTLQVGWAKVNMTPPRHNPLAGYGKRRGMKYTSVHDSAYVRTFAFNNGKSQAYLVALDLLITPMAVTEALEKVYPNLGLQPEQVYLTATHTHTSFGGWGKKLMGRIMAGKYDRKIVQATVDRILESLVLAKANQQPARVGYGEIYAAELVANRLTGDAAALDTTMRFLKFEQKGGATALFCSFSAHPTILPSMQPILSRDYPGALVDSLETQVDFAAFAAGAVASHQTKAPHGDSFSSTEAVGRQLASKLLAAEKSVPMAYQQTLGYARVPFELPATQWRSGDTHRFAPFLFRTVFGNYGAYVSSLQIGSMVLLGVPADYSGEYMKQLQPAAQQHNKEVVVTGFNGGYIGYITPEEHYPLKKYETRDMNFYGPYTGTYLTEILQRLLRLHEQK
ncbi:neutral/alkaline non-lysosomal ceramidase N-terminal domain-containing protein [Pontibacter qinzhouensis]|uniref:neutral/alkaline non-lysosomal ceramidase N-terminal domain-containing protein n=1 Tax=Pontibacter qinzhouensis TaxID=2603253 RepID=UPI0021039532|nr:neutral/alkaline non-lysosomal ceramidase N-terminal domain-containing protein [Pontibacter qinzhouensis]